MSTMTQIDNINGVRFVTSNHMSHGGPIFFWKNCEFLCGRAFYFLKASSLQIKMVHNLLLSCIYFFQILIKKLLGLKMTDLHRRLWANYSQFIASDHDHVNYNSVIYATFFKTLNYRMKQTPLRKLYICSRKMKYHYMIKTLNANK